MSESQSPDTSAVEEQFLKVISGNPTAGPFLERLLEHLDAMAPSALEGKVLVEMFEFSRKYPDLALLIASVGNVGR